MLENQWDKILESLRTKLCQQAKKDTHCERLVELIEQIPNEVRREALTKYLSQCRSLYAIAFLQWRRLWLNHFDNMHQMTSDQDIKSLIHARIECHLKNLNP